MTDGTTKTKPLAVVIMAAGKGTRMNNPDMAKVMYPINDRPMIDFVLDLSLRLAPDRVLLIVGWQKDSVIQHVAERKSKIECIEQVQQLGTGHAIMQTSDHLREFGGDVLVLSGDVPLLTEKTLRALVGYHRTSAAVATILTAEVEDPSGYGRIVRNDDESVKKIVEHKDASKEERSIGEINSGIYVFDGLRLFEALRHITTDNVQREYYLTDVFEYFWKQKWHVSAVKALDSIEVMGVNDLVQLETARQIMASRASK